MRIFSMRTYGQQTTNRKNGRWNSGGGHKNCPECLDRESHGAVYGQTPAMRRRLRRIFKTRARRKGARDIADQLG